jgi:hypothetical protein
VLRRCAWCAVLRRRRCGRRSSPPPLIL